MVFDFADFADLISVYLVARYAHCIHTNRASHTISSADGTSSNCASIVPASRLPVSHTTALRNCDSLTRPSTTSSVIADMCGSMNTAIITVAPPLMIDDSVLDVTRTFGSSTPAYSAANTPTVHNATAATLSSVIDSETPPPLCRAVTLAGAGALAAPRIYEMPPLNNACISSLGIERCTWKCSTARQNTRWKVGISSAPAMVASDAETSSQRKSDSKSVTTACDKFDSTRLARNGPRKEFEVRETSTSMLNSASETAMRRVRTPAMRTEYASVPIRWMTKVSKQITSNCLSIAALKYGEVRLAMLS